MIVVGYCPECGKPIYGTPFADDPMASITFVTCTCAGQDTDGISDDDSGYSFGSGDFVSNSYGGGY